MAIEFLDEPLKKKRTELFFNIGDEPPKTSGVEFLDEDEQPKPSGSKVEFLDETPTAQPVNPSVEFLDEPPKTTGLFGTHIGENSELLRQSRIPANKSREGLKKITDAIPDAETSSFSGNALLNTPKVLAEIGSELSASMLDPETVIVAGAGKALKPVLASPIVKKGVAKAAEVVPEGVKRVLSYRFGQPKEYVEGAEAAASNIGSIQEAARDLGNSLSKGLSRAEQLRVGQLLKGGISVSDRESALRALTVEPKKVMGELEKVARSIYTGENKTLLPEVTYNTKLTRRQGAALRLEKTNLLKKIDDVLQIGKRERIEKMVKNISVEGMDVLRSEIIGLRNSIMGAKDKTIVALEKQLGGNLSDYLTKLIVMTKTSKEKVIDSLLDLAGKAEKAGNKRLSNSIFKYASKFEGIEDLKKIQQLTDKTRVGIFDELIKAIGGDLDELSDKALKAGGKTLDVGVSGVNQVLKELAKEPIFKGKQSLINSIIKEVQLIDEKLFNSKLFGNTPYFARLYRDKETSTVGKKMAQIFGSSVNKIGGQRFLKRQNIPEATRLKMGEIKEAAYPTAKAIAQMGHDVEIAKLFSKVANNPAWASSKPIGDFVQLSGTPKKLGLLAGKYVHPEIARDINELVRMPGTAEKIYMDLLSKWKFGKVVLNPATHSRNMMSNAIFLDLSGTSLEKQPGLLVKSLTEMKKKGKYFQEAKEADLLGHEFVGAEIQNLLDNFSKPARTVFGKIIEVAKSLGNKAGNVYRKEEQWFKLAKFIDGREKGLGVKEAAKEAEKWGFNYSKISPAIRAIKRIPLGSPFLTYASKAMPRLAEVAAKNPLRLYKYEMLFNSIEKVAQQRLGISDDELKTIKRNARGKVVIMPKRDHAGKIQTTDLSYILPWGDIGEQGGMFNLPPALSPGGPLKAPLEVGFNKSTFTSKPIFLEADSKKEKIKKSVDYLYKAFFPSFAPPVPGLTKGGYSTSKLIAGVKGTPDYHGRVRKIGTVLADVFLGLKASPVEPEQLKKFEKIILKKETNEILSDAKKRMRNKGLTPIERYDIKRKARERVTEILLDSVKEN